MLGQHGECVAELTASFDAVHDSGEARPARWRCDVDEFTYRYASGTFEAELVVDDEGLVASYAEWRRTGIAIGPESTEPLDIH